MPGGAEKKVDKGPCLGFKSPTSTPKEGRMAQREAHKVIMASAVAAAGAQKPMARRGVA